VIITEKDWQELEAGQVTAGRSVRRLYPDSHHDLYIGVTHPGLHRLLVLKVDAPSAESAARSIGRLAKTSGLTMSLSSLSRLEYELQVTLAADELREVFSPLAADIASVAQATSTSKDALLAVVNRFDHWQNLLRTLGSEGLGSDARRGLVGELMVLRDFVLPALLAVEAVTAWTGPAGANQDFQLPALAIEVKASSAKSPQRLRIASERQLDSVGTPELLLCSISLDERHGGSGESLNVLVDDLRGRLGNAVARSRLDNLLVQAGYLTIHKDLYKEPRYTLRQVRFWRVEGSFPRIVEFDLRPGVGECSYTIDTAGLDEYLVPNDEVAGRIGGADG
jgi:Putative  PD-(D/E)XK family member, (DUF4420)